LTVCFFNDWALNVLENKNCVPVAARQDQNRVGTSNFFGQFFRVIFFLTLHQLNGGDGYNAYYYKVET
jgi:hypothetical protein